MNWIQISGKQAMFRCDDVVGLSVSFEGDDCKTLRIYLRSSEPIKITDDRMHINRLYDEIVSYICDGGGVIREINPS